MPIYKTLGKIPHKRHTAFRNKSGGIFYEQLMGNQGFAGIQSLIYALGSPTSVTAVEPLDQPQPQPASEPGFGLRHFYTHRLAPTGTSPVLDRAVLLHNEDVAISITRPAGTDDFFYRNGRADEIVFVTQGGGTLESQFGELPFGAHDYLVIPRGIVHRFRLDDTEQLFFVVESRDYVRTPERYRNAHGQLLEHSPFCERDIRGPERLVVHDDRGDFRIVVRKPEGLYRVQVERHPFDVVGWDGFYYPWALSIDDFEPITGRIHQPPPVHQTFEGQGWVLCSFVPRLFDYHPESIPAPYNHSNVGTDEVLYYVSNEFMSRKRIESGSITLHPDGLPHGPHPGKIEESIGVERTDELAVMIDCRSPLGVTAAALSVEDDGYRRSWIG